MEGKFAKPIIEIIYLINRDLIVTSDGSGLNDIGGGNYSLPEVPLP